MIDNGGMAGTEVSTPLGGIDPAVSALWSYVTGLGWAWSFLPSGGWSGRTSGNASGVTYTPADECASGWLECHDEDRTLTFTGIVDAAEAVERTRLFFGWPAQNPVRSAPQVRTNGMR